MQKVTINMNLLIFDYTLVMALLGTSLLGATAGLLSPFVFLRRQSLLGDAISHAALPGIVLACLITKSKHPLILLTGAAIAGTLGTAFISLVRHYTAIKNDTILGIVLSVFFGCGLVLLTALERYPELQTASIQKFLFGNAACFTGQEIMIIALVALVVITVTIAAHKEFTLSAFDNEFGIINGIAMQRYNVLFTAVLILTIIIGLQTVGVILMSTMLIAPASAARQWTRHIGSMMYVSAGIGLFACVCGICISSMSIHVPTGPVIVFLLCCVVFVSLLLAPDRSIIWKLKKS